MNPSNQDDKLELLLHRTLREQPVRRAPATLQAKVFAELERRARQPWWQKSFMHWPLAARAAFVVLCAVLVKVIADASMWVIGGIELAPIGHDVMSIGTWLRITVSVTATILHNIPAAWIYVGFAVVGALYTALFGISAAAYRTLYAPLSRTATGTTR